MGAKGLEQARSALARGDLLMAYDAAAAAAESDDHDAEARYVRALALVQLGAVERATEAIADLVRAVDAREVPVELREDVAALGARLAKDRAFQHEGAAFVDLAATAARAYEEVADRYGRFYAAINAATLWVLAGDAERAERLARRSRDLAGASPSSYWSEATMAEAELILGDLGACATSLERAAVLGGGDLAARATTYRQLRRLCTASGRGHHLLELLRIPLVVHYCGNMRPGSGLAPSAWEQSIVEGVSSFLSERPPAIAYGALAGGADIVIAEQLLQRGAELHVVLPFSIEEFESVSVRAAGPGWVERFRRCLEQSSTCVVATDSAYLDDDSVFGFAGRIAMGHALNHANSLGIDAEQIAVSDGREWSSVAGTAREVEAWSRAGGVSHTIDIEDRDAVSVHLKTATDTPSPGTAASPCHAVIFADFHGFGRLCDEHYLAFITGVLGPVADTVEEHGEAVLYKNSWGDAIQLVVRDVVSAASCALRIQHTVQSLDLEALGLPFDLGLRVAAHVGRLVAVPDPIRNVPSFWGREMTRAARIEPRTPEGEVYVTDSFAALLALEPDAAHSCEYVGRVTTDKNFETIPMYRLRRS